MLVVADDHQQRAVLQLRPREGAQRGRHALALEAGTHEELMTRQDGLYKSLSKLQYEWQ